jgi:beta-mannosidase
MRMIDLGGEWDIDSLDGEYSLKGRVPGTLFEHLETRGDFGPGGISYRENNRRCAPIAERDFRYSRGFEIDGDSLPGAGRPVFLEADGLDTLATLILNGVEIGKAENMHRRWRFDAGKALRKGANRIEIRFANAPAYCRREWPASKPWHTAMENPEICYPGFNAIRKSHCSFGWDWGPIVPDLGIWRPIRLVKYDQVRIAGIEVRQSHSPGGRVSLSVNAETEEYGNDRAYSLRFDLTHPDGRVEGFDAPPGKPLRIEVSEPRLWWPNGMGGQPLYGLRAQARAGTEVLHEKSIKLGLRTLGVNRTRDRWGESFEFAANGVPFFARGADYIPEDLCLARAGRARTERLLRDSVSANFNCIRVWGGGVYPSEDFYDLCDELGLVVWQDLMFACALYDFSAPAFRENVIAEVRDNLERIRHRACLGLVCGNNEMETALIHWNIHPSKKAKRDYLEQYERVFPRLMKEVCPDVFYWPSSPSSGGAFRDPNSPDRGDCHYWEVWHGNKDFSEFSKHYFRFMSEFGFESFPSMKTIRSFALPEDLNVAGPVMEDHQRCIGGNGKIMSYAARYFRFPKGFPETVYLSQICQADALRHGMEHWRRNRGRCMGSVYWQLNDNWPVASWSSIDHAGRWKALHYFARRSYAPLLVSTFQPEARGLSPLDHILPLGNGHFTRKPALIEIHLSNESRETAEGEIGWELIGLDGERLEQGSIQARASGFSSVMAGKLDFTARIRGREAPRGALLSWKAGLGGKRLSGFHAFLPYKQLELRDPELSFSVQPAALRLSAAAPALFVEIDHEDYDLRLSDNFFFMDGRNDVVVGIERATLNGKDVDVSAAGFAEALATGLRLRSLFDSYSGA